MAYVFETESAATLKFTKSENTERTMTLQGINATLPSADSIVAGIQTLLWITDQAADYEPTDGVRTVKQNVNEQ